VSTPIPDPCVHPGQPVCAKPGVTAKGRPSYPDKPAQGKLGRVTAKESSLRLRYYRLPERWLTKTAIKGQEARFCIASFSWEAVIPPSRTPGPRSIEGTHPQRVSQLWNVATPLQSGSASKRTARKAEFCSGHRTVPEAKATRRKARGNHNPVDRAFGPRRKAADGDRVSHPKDVAKVANRRTS
jgi:hypothetical protein